MYKKISLCCLLFLLGGCASTSTNNELNTKEKLLLQTGDYQKLVPLYKAQLMKGPNPDIRLKLAEAYLKSGDPESALFTSAPLLTAKQRSTQLYLIQAYSYYELGDMDKALKHAKTADYLEKNNPDTENLLGLIAVSVEDYSAARSYFNLARAHFYDDIKIKNNLATLDLIEGEYQHAVQLLLPMYLNHNHDDQLKANLLMALAKSGDFSTVQSMLVNDYSAEEIEEMYHALRNTSMLTESSLVTAPIHRVDPVTLPSTPVVEPTTSPIVVASSPVVEPTESAVVVAPAPLVESTNRSVKSTKSPVKSTPVTFNKAQQPANHHYGPVKVDETLWSISLRLRPNHSVSVLQTMLAIYKRNPHAFLRGNLNNMIPAVMLNVPSVNFIEQQTYQDAMRLIEKYDKKRAARANNLAELTEAGL